MARVRVRQTAFLSRLIARFGKARFSYPDIMRYLRMRGYRITKGQVTYHCRVHGARNTQRPEFDYASMDRMAGWTKQTRVA